jgi:hypothetical protein
MKVGFVRFLVLILLVGCAGAPQATFPGPPRPREEIALLRESHGAYVWAIDGERASGAAWGLLPGEHRIVLRIRFFELVSNVNWKFRGYCHLVMAAAAGKEYVTFVRLRHEADPTDSLKMAFGIEENGGPATVPTRCGREQPSL